MYNFFHISNKYMYVGLGPLINRKKREKNQSHPEDFSTVTPLAYFHNHRYCRWFFTDFLTQYYRYMFYRYDWYWVTCKGTSDPKTLTQVGFWHISFQIGEGALLFTTDYQISVHEFFYKGCIKFFTLQDQVGGSWISHTIYVPHSLVIQSKLMK